MKITYKDALLERIRPVDCILVPRMTRKEKIKITIGNIIITLLMTVYLLGTGFLSYSNILDRYTVYQKEKEFNKKLKQDLTALRQTIIEIRESKLPDPTKLGNAGSFFKNPVVPDSEFQQILKHFPGIHSFPAGQGKTKIPAAWLIEKAGWKGTREGNVGTYPSQPLVIVNYGGATGKEILEFAMKIVDSVKKKFGVELEMEVNVV